MLNDSMLKMVVNCTVSHNRLPAFSINLTLTRLCADKTIKLWKISERDKRAEGYNLKDEEGRLRDPFRISSLRVRLELGSPP